MAAGSQAGGWTGPSRRRVPRYRILAPLDVTLLRSGIPDKVPGRALNVCERGMGAILAVELKTGESVAVELRLAPTGEPLRTRATVRYQDKLRYGLEFTGISAEQRNIIREWAKGVKRGAEAKRSTRVLPNVAEPGRARIQKGPPLQRGGDGRAPFGGRWGKVTVIAAVLAIIVALALWWRWNRSWEELESGLKGAASGAVEKPAAQVAPEVMQKLLVHRVEPVYPVEARNQRLQGVIAVKVIVGRDGSVVNMQALNGPEILAQAAMDALRWWKFEPYRVNGEPAAVETTLAVEFRR